LYIGWEYGRYIKAGLHCESERIRERDEIAATLRASRWPRKFKFNDPKPTLARYVDCNVALRVSVVIKIDDRKLTVDD